MRTTTALIVTAAGAVLAFAVNGGLPFFDPNAAGWVVMLAGIVALFFPPGPRRVLRQRLIQRGRYGPAMELRHRAYSRWLMPGGLLQPGTEEIAVEGAVIEEQVIEE